MKFLSKNTSTLASVVLSNRRLSGLKIKLKLKVQIRVSPPIGFDVLLYIISNKSFRAERLFHRSGTPAVSNLFLLGLVLSEETQTSCDIAVYFIYLLSHAFPVLRLTLERINFRTLENISHLAKD